MNALGVLIEGDPDQLLVWLPQLGVISQHRLHAFEERHEGAGAQRCIDDTEVRLADCDYEQLRHASVVGFQLGLRRRESTERVKSADGACARRELAHVATGAPQINRGGEVLSRRQEGGALTGELALDRQLDGEAGEEKEVVVVLADISTSAGTPNIRRSAFVQRSSEPCERAGSMAQFGRIGSVEDLEVDIGAQLATPLLERPVVKPAVAAFEPYPGIIGNFPAGKSDAHGT